MSHSILRCAICGKLLLLEEAKADGDGKAAHEHCIVSKMTGGESAPSGNRIPSKPSE
jgi:hypothetical protein